MFRKDTFEITLRPNQSVTYSGARDVQLPAKDGNAVLVSSGDIVNADISASAAIVDTKLATISTAGKVSNSATTASSSAGNNTIVARDGSGNFSAGTITATLSGNASNITASSNSTLTTLSALSLPGSQVSGNISGNSANVTGIVAGANGGTGVANTGKTVTLGGNLTTSGAFATTLTATNTTNVTLPTTGTLATLSGSETLLNKAISSTAALTGALQLPAGNNTTERPTPTAGMIRYNSTDAAFEGYANGAWSSIGGGGTTDRVTQASHGFVLGDVLYLNGSTYTKAIATSAAAAEVVGVVSRVLDSSTFDLTLSGEVTGLSGLVAGEAYFLSPSVAGGITTIEPSVIGQVSVPVGVASSTTSLYVAPKRGNVIGGVNARSQISLSAVTTAQPVYSAPAGLDAGELTGWVYLDATTDSKFYVSAKFAKNGAGSDWNIAPSYVGDTPPAGFSMGMSSSGIISITMNPLPAGFVSGYINYALNAPAVGATFPLAISGSSVTGGTPLVDTVNENTVNNGVQIQGRKSGVAIPSGYVGELLQVNVNTVIDVTNATLLESNLTTLTLTAGVWEISGVVLWQRAGATITSPEYISGIVPNGETLTVAAEGGMAMQYTSATFTGVRVATPVVRVICTGSSMLYYAKGTGVSFATNTIALRTYSGGWSAGTPKYGGSLRAVRIA